MWTSCLFLVCELLLLFVCSKHITIQFSRLTHTLFYHHKVSGFILALLFLPGTLVHELAHYLMAVIVRVRAVSFTLFPKIGSDNIILGSVGIVQSDPFRRFLIGVAPVVAGLTLILFTINYFLLTNSSVTSAFGLLFIYGLFTVSNTMFSSRADMEGAWKLLLIVLLILGAIYLLGFRPQLSLDTAVPTLIKASKILLIPVILDLVILSALIILNLLLKKARNLV
jgi:hypothetical protein